MVANYDEVMKLALERGFYFPSCEIYADAPAGFWEYGPTGVNMKNKFVELWRRELVRRDSMLEIDGCQIMSRSVFVASGHIGNFTDPVVKCTTCSSTFRADRYITENTGEYVPERMAEKEIDLLIKKYKLTLPKLQGGVCQGNQVQHDVQRWHRSISGSSIPATGNLPVDICRLCTRVQDNARSSSAWYSAGREELQK